MSKSKDEGAPAQTKKFFPRINVAAGNFTIKPRDKRLDDGSFVADLDGVSELTFFSRNQIEKSKVGKKFVLRLTKAECAQLLAFISSEMNL